MENLSLEIRGFLGAILVFVLSFTLFTWIVKKIVPHAKRPPIITVLCLFLGFGMFKHIQLFLSQEASLQSSLFFLVNLVLGTVWIVGIWKMKRWGVIGYVATIIISQIPFLLQGKVSIFQLLFIFPIFILFFYYPKMK